MLAGIFGNQYALDVTINEGQSKKFALIARGKKESIKAPIFSDGENLEGTAVVSLKPGKKLEHNGIKVEIVGQCDVLHDRSSSCDFFTIAKDLEPPGVLMDTTKYKFLFNSVDMAYDTYQGVNVRLRYFVRLCIARSYATSISKEVDVIVQNLGIPPEVNNTIKMEVGIEDCLHIEFEYDKSRYHLRDVVVGKVYFLLVRIKIKHMELDIVRTETAGAGSNAVTDSETFAKFEIMDGAPIRSECIPVRMYLSGFDLFPTQKNIVHRFSVRYWLNLVLVDEEDRRYFKKQEIILWRKKIG
eukprot:GHVT01013845.1.p1 GENE.GHVT01013845.1~~GHVT01013845.1.p1  ORF type:complete len:299 (-),score=49.99 GHVT01013845.1:487-1383(-)